MKKLIVAAIISMFLFSGISFAGGNCTADYQCGHNGYCYKEKGRTFGTCK